MLDVLLVSVFVFGALLYLAVLVVKKVRALRDPKAGAGCSCGTPCEAKRPLLRAGSKSRAPNAESDD